VETFARFYEAATARNEALVRNLLESSRLSPVASGPLLILVAGGFHAAGIVKLLEKEGLDYAVVSPRIRKLEEDKDALEVFRKGRSPLDRVLLGEKIFLADPVTVGAVAPLSPETADTASVQAQMWAVTAVAAEPSIVDRVNAALKGEGFHPVKSVHVGEEESLRGASRVPLRLTVERDGKETTVDLTAIVKSGTLQAGQNAAVAKWTRGLKRVLPFEGEKVYRVGSLELEVWVERNVDLRSLFAPDVFARTVDVFRGRFPGLSRILSRTWRSPRKDAVREPGEEEGDDVLRDAMTELLSDADVVRAEGQFTAGDAKTAPESDPIAVFRLSTERNWRELLEFKRPSKEVVVGSAVKDPAQFLGEDRKAVLASGREMTLKIGRLMKERGLPLKGVRLVTHRARGELPPDASLRLHEFARLDKKGVIDVHADYPHALLAHLRKENPDAALTLDDVFLRILTHVFAEEGLTEKQRQPHDDLDRAGVGVTGALAGEELEETARRLLGVEDSLSTEVKKLFKLRSAVQYDARRIMQQHLGGDLGDGILRADVERVLHRVLQSNGFSKDSAQVFIGNSYLPNAFTLLSPSEAKFMQENSDQAKAFRVSNVFLSLGLLRSVTSEAGLAFVLAHELAHNRKGHLKDVQGSHMVLGHFHEFEADVEALKMIAAAGYDPKQAVDTLYALHDEMERLEKKYAMLKRSKNDLTEALQRVRDIHPHPDLRRAYMLEFLNEAEELLETFRERRPPLSAVISNHGAWLRQVPGVVGVDETQGPVWRKTSVNVSFQTLEQYESARKSGRLREQLDGYNVAYWAKPGAAGIKGPLPGRPVWMVRREAAARPSYQDRFEARVWKAVGEGTLEEKLRNLEEFIQKEEAKDKLDFEEYAVIEEAYRRVIENADTPEQLRRVEISAVRQRTLFFPTRKLSAGLVTQQIQLIRNGVLLDRWKALPDREKAASLAQALNDLLRRDTLYKALSADGLALSEAAAALLARAKEAKEQTEKTGRVTRLPETDRLALNWALLAAVYPEAVAALSAGQGYVDPAHIGAEALARWQKLLSGFNGRAGALNRALVTKMRERGVIKPIRLSEFFTAAAPFAMVSRRGGALQIIGEAATREQLDDVYGVLSAEAELLGLSPRLYPERSHPLEPDLKTEHINAVARSLWGAARQVLTRELGRPARPEEIIDELKAKLSPMWLKMYLRGFQTQIVESAFGPEGHRSQDLRPSGLVVRLASLPPQFLKDRVAWAGQPIDGLSEWARRHYRNFEIKQSGGLALVHSYERYYIKGLASPSAEDQLDLARHFLVKHNLPEPFVRILRRDGKLEAFLRLAMADLENELKKDVREATTAEDKRALVKAYSEIVGKLLTSSLKDLKEMKPIRETSELIWNEAKKVFDSNEVFQVFDKESRTALAQKIFGSMNAAFREAIVRMNRAGQRPSAEELAKTSALVRDLEKVLALPPGKDILEGYAKNLLENIKDDAEYMESYRAALPYTVKGERIPLTAAIVLVLAAKFFGWVADNLRIFGAIAVIGAGAGFYYVAPYLWLTGPALIVVGLWILFAPLLRTALRKAAAPFRWLSSKIGTWWMNRRWLAKSKLPDDKLKPRPLSALDFSNFLALLGDPSTGVREKMMLAALLDRLDIARVELPRGGGGFGMLAAMAAMHSAERNSDLRATAAVGRWFVEDAVFAARTREELEGLVKIMLRLNALHPALLQPDLAETGTVHNAFRSGANYVKRSEPFRSLAKMEHPFRLENRRWAEELIRRLDAAGAWPEKASDRLDLLDFMNTNGSYSEAVDERILTEVEKDPAAFKKWVKMDRLRTAGFGETANEDLKEIETELADTPIAVPTTEPLMIVRNPVLRTRLFRFLPEFHLGEKAKRNLFRWYKGMKRLWAAYRAAREYYSRQFLLGLRHEGSLEDKFFEVLEETDRVSAWRAAPYRPVSAGTRAASPMRTSFSSRRRKRSTLSAPGGTASSRTRKRRSWRPTARRSARRP
jgi:hypothetical protein